MPLLCIASLVMPLPHPWTYPLTHPLAATSAWAQTYRPPEGEPPSGPYTSNGSRTSCGEQFEVPLTALVPTGHVGQSISPTPMLAWFVPASAPYRIGLSLYQVGEGGQPEFLHQLEYVETDESASHIANLTLPTEDFSLMPGQRYFWEVSLACQPESPLYDQSFVAELAIASPSPTLTAALATAQTPLQKAEIYAGAGHWYDALQAALQISERRERTQMVNTLLTELAELEAGLHSQWLLEISDTLTSPLERSDEQGVTRIQSQLPTRTNGLQ